MREADLIEIFIDDFSELLISEGDTENVPLNGSPNAQNWRVSREGQLEQRNGYAHLVNPSLNGVDIDGMRWFKDAGGNQHLAVWRGGNLYDMLTAGTLIASAVYAAGRRVCHAVRSGILYFSDGSTYHAPGNVGVYQWNPINGATPHEPVDFPGEAGQIPIPPCNVMALINGQLVLGDCAPYGFDPEPDSLRWTDPNFPERCLATDVYPVDKGSGGAINCIVPMALATESLQPTDGFFVGKEEGVYIATGPVAVNDLKVVRINCEDGVLDGASAQFIRLPEGRGTVVFLGDSYRMWATEGINALDISSKFIRRELRDYVRERLELDPGARFTSVRVFDDCLYLLDCGGNRQYVLDWRRMRWMRYEGWPSGYWTEAELYLKANSVLCGYRNSSNDVFIAYCNSGYSDNGARIDSYWETPDLKGGVGEGYANVGSSLHLKRFMDCFVDFFTNRATVKCTFTADRAGGDSGDQSHSVDNGVVDSTPTYDSGLTYDSGVLYAAASTSTTFSQWRRRFEIFKRDAATERTWRITGRNLRVRIEQTETGRHLGINSLNIVYQMRKGGRGRVAS